MDLNLKGKSALVTGGISGIGRSIVAALLAEGRDVHVGELNAGERSAEEIGARRARLLRLDVGEAAGVQQAIDGIMAGGGRIDILVNCAGILKTRPLVESTIARASASRQSSDGLAGSNCVHVLLGSAPCKTCVSACKTFARLFASLLGNDTVEKPCRGCRPIYESTC
jgi:NAD(P)-dependent dehydrogenase (short-subunit alcohol dehydrogenase family)